ncbi:MAG: tripartite tricarboxylate transporter permease [Streptosporangiales bacterium]|nr:tripartite tricarboxylate transporter permease [Streptosporangiales bacterium]
MDGVFDNVLLGFQTAFSPANLLYCFGGVVLGTFIGMLPGLGSATGVALLLPLTLTLDPISALIMLAGIYYGCQYGASISSILIATPGDSASVVTAFDGYPLARTGRAGQALATSVIASFVAGTITIIPLMTLAPIFSGLALNFGPPEMFALMVLGMASVVGFGGGTSQAKGLAMAAFGVAISTVGIDAQTGIARYTFGQVQLLDGIGFLGVVIGLFAVAEVMAQVGRGGAEPIRTRMRDMLMSRRDLREISGPTARGGVVGFLVGMLPGAGATLASFFAYDIERRVSKKPERFGKGALPGVAGPEAANNAAANAAFVPTLTLGIPGSGTTAVLLGAFIIFGLQPGPLFLREQPELAWGLMASFYLGNLLLLAMNLPLAPVLGSLLRIRYSLLYPLILLVALIGAYAMQNRMWGVWLGLAFGVIGYVMHKYGYPAAPLILGLILGSLMEKTLTQTSDMGGGDLTIFFNRPIALLLFALALVLLLAPYLVKAVRRMRPAPTSTPPDGPADDAASARSGDEEMTTLSRREDG